MGGNTTLLCTDSFPARERDTQFKKLSVTHAGRDERRHGLTHFGGGAESDEFAKRSLRSLQSSAVSAKGENNTLLLTDIFLSRSRNYFTVNRKISHFIINHDASKCPSKIADT